MYRRVVCPNCGDEIGWTEFEVDSQYPGTLDTGYDCKKCKLIVYTYKVERSKAKEDDEIQNTPQSDESK